MKNLKFNLVVIPQHDAPDVHLGARVFDLFSLLAVHRAIQHGVMGHHSKKSYYLVEYQQDGLSAVSGYGENTYQFYPKGGKEINPVLIGLFSHLAISSLK